jgi:hypothetical protein
MSTLECCECCGADLTEENTVADRLCPKCGGGMCEHCDMGRGCVCIKCDQEKE